MDINYIKTCSKTRLGANYNIESGCVDFKLYSKNATVAILCIYENPIGADSFLDIKMDYDDVNKIFYTSVKAENLFNLERAFYYGYRVFGPNFEYTEDFKPGTRIGFKSFVDSKGNRFNPNKIAYDPYTKELSHLHSSVSHDMDIFRSGTKYAFDDNAKLAPKSVFRMCEDIDIPLVSQRALKDEIIGEVHLKDLTQLSFLNTKGTYIGAGEYAGHVKKLGITMIEFLPLFEFDNKAEGGNYWGYMPLCYFAPVKNYVYDKKDGNAINEFRQMIKAFHDEDIKVCLDVVYNHTGEARVYNHDKNDVNLFSYALIDNASYYKTSNEGFYANNSGCHNDSNTADTMFRDLITDSLEFWIKQGVDAFRFDLAVSLMDTDSSINCKYDKNNGYVAEIKSRLEERGIKVLNPDEEGNGVHLIAEPWTCGGTDTYQLGNFPSCFAEWNDVAKNTIRANTTRIHSTDALGLRYLIEGIPYKFNGKLKSVNFIASHDGFTLWDLNTYDKKSPNTSGGSDWELSSSYDGNMQLRENAIRKQTALLMMSYGIVMLQIGDIVLHSKNGNNNSYNIDGIINWIEFNIPDAKKSGLSEYIKSMIEFRKHYTVLSNIDYVKKLEYYRFDARRIEDSDSLFWSSGKADFLGIKVNDTNSLYAAVSKSPDTVRIKLPANMEEKKWHLITDTNTNDVLIEGGAQYDSYYALKPYSMAIFTER